jgi:hypothetical protein
MFPARAAMNLLSWRCGYFLSGSRDLGCNNVALTDGSVMSAIIFQHQCQCFAKSRKGYGRERIHQLVRLPTMTTNQKAAVTSRTIFRRERLRIESPDDVPGGDETK